MTKTILQRLGISFIILTGVSIVAFSATWFFHGNADESLPQRYFAWLGGLFTGDLGTSVSTGGPITEVLGQTVGNSLVLLAASALIAIPTGILMGIYSALRRGTKRATAIRQGALLLTALPEFILGIVLIALFASSVLQILPATVISPADTGVWAYPLQLVLPILTLVLVATPYMVRLTHSSISEIQDAEFIEMARLKGVPENHIIWRHVLPHTLGPIVKGLAVQFAWIIGSLVVVEYLFRYPGIGQALVNAVFLRDVPVVQILVLLITVSYVLLHLLAELTSILANPRLRRTA